jgi:hypothetical protein
VLDHCPCNNVWERVTFIFFSPRHHEGLMVYVCTYSFIVNSTFMQPRLLSICYKYLMFGSYCNNEQAV